MDALLKQIEDAAAREPYVEFFVPGDAKPAGSKTAVQNQKWAQGLAMGFTREQMKGRVKQFNVFDQTGKKGESWRENVAFFARNAMNRARRKRLATGPLALFVQFERKRPKDHYGVKGNVTPKHVNDEPTGPADVTKLLRAIEDAMKGVVYEDDALIIVQLAGKRYADDSGARVRVVELSGPSPSSDQTASLPRASSGGAAGAVTPEERTRP